MQKQMASKKKRRMRNENKNKLQTDKFWPLEQSIPPTARKFVNLFQYTFRSPLLFFTTIIFLFNRHRESFFLFIRDTIEPTILLPTKPVHFCFVPIDLFFSHVIELLGLFLLY